jgi:tripartite-type tricarboxylate transporter receptor subunit TctC
MKKFCRFMCLLGLLGLCMTSFGQSYPNKPVKILVGFPPGGATDVIARLLAQGLSDSFGQSFYVENKGGASGTIATGMLAKSEADGHTLILVPSTHSSVPSL